MVDNQNGRLEIQLYKKYNFFTCQLSELRHLNIYRMIRFAKDHI